MYLDLYEDPIQPNKEKSTTFVLILSDTAVRESWNRHTN